MTVFGKNFNAIVARSLHSDLPIVPAPASRESRPVSAPFAVSRLSVVIVVAALTAHSSAQTPSPRDVQERQPPIRTQANYVRVDVYPTTDGRPVMDLRVEDFELSENGTPQTVSAFEHVVIATGGPQTQRTDPQSVTAATQAAANPRSRILIIFLDAAHVTIEGTWQIREPLIRLIDRTLGSDDLVALMTPEMAPSQITLARKTEVVEGGLRNAWPWGTRHTLHEDEREVSYRACYPPTTEEALAGKTISDLARALIARRRERLSIEALNDLVHYLRDLREERKAILTVTEGWLLYRPDPSLMAPRDKYDIPRTEPIGVGEGGKLRPGADAKAYGAPTLSECNTDRMRLAQEDNERFFRLIIDDANRANASFYTIDPRGLAVFDTPIGPEKPLPPHADRASLTTRLEAMKTLAAATDGLWVVGSNDLDAGLKRIADDLTSYYLLGYYSTNTKLDGSFRRIGVRIKRPGVQVRARRGYRAPTEAEVLAARAAAAPPPISAEAEAAASATAALARIRPEARFRIHAAPAVDGPDESVSVVWIAGELQPPPAADPWKSGGTGEITVTAGTVTATARVTLAAGERTFLTPVSLPSRVSGGSLDVRARLTGTDPTAARLADSIHVPLTAGARLPLLFRRGPATGNRLLPAATFLFSRTERVRVEIPVGAAAKPGTGRLLDRGGQPLPVPVTVATRTDDATGRHWITADVTLAPLGAGDYTIEVSMLSGSEHKVMTAIRVVR
jgi:VWFA-related protein